MTLPDLPIKHKQREADFGLQFREWFEYYGHLLPDDCQFEHKQTENNVFYLRNIKPKQWKKNKGLIRLSVATAGTADYMKVTTLPLYIVIKYPKDWVIIPIEKLNKDVHKLTYEDALQLDIKKSII